MRRLRLGAFAVVLGLAGAARADVVSFRAELHGGGGFGGGISGDHKDDTFFGTAPHGAYGVLAGVEILFLDIWVQHHQFTNGSHLATWSQLGVGLDMQIPIGDPGEPDAEGKRAKPKAYGEIGMGVGAGLGTGQQVDPPLDASEITDKGFLFEVVGAVGYHLAPVVDVGVRAPVSVGYFIKSGAGATANDLSSHYVGWEAAVLLYVRLQLTLY